MKRKYIFFLTFSKNPAVFVWQFFKFGGVGYERGNQLVTRFCGSKRRREHE